MKNFFKKRKIIKQAIKLFEEDLAQEDQKTHVHIWYYQFSGKWDSLTLRTELNGYPVTLYLDEYWLKISGDTPLLHVRSNAFGKLLPKTNKYKRAVKKRLDEDKARREKEKIWEKLA